MTEPTMNAEITQAMIDAAKAGGLPVIDGKQAVATARKKNPDTAAANWYALEDGSTVIRDDNGDPAEWPGVYRAPPPPDDEPA